MLPVRGKRPWDAQIPPRCCLSRKLLRGQACKLKHLWTTSTPRRCCFICIAASAVPALTAADRARKPSPHRALAKSADQTRTSACAACSWSASQIRSAQTVRQSRLTQGKVAIDEWVEKGRGAVAERETSTT